MSASGAVLIAALALLAVLALLGVRRAGQELAVAAALIAGSVALAGLQWQALPGIIVAIGAAFFVWRGLASGRGVGAGLAAGAVLSALPFWFFPVFSLPVPEGAHPVGTIAIEMTDTARRGVLGRPAGEPRRLPVRIWYPGAAGEVGPRAAYTGRTEAMSLGTTFGEPWFLYTALASVRANGMEGIRAAAGKWPVVLLNHGFWSYKEQNTAIAEHLASHGYIVVSIGHPGDSVTYRFADGHEIPPFMGGTEDSEATKALEQGIATFMGAATEEGRFKGLSLYDAGSAGHRINASAHAWRDDNLFVLGALQRAAPASAAAIVETADFSRVAVAGMSFGGSAAPSACARIANCRAAINLDGESFDFSLYNADLGRPLLLMLTGQKFASSQRDDPDTNPTDYAYERWAVAGETPGIYRMRVETMRHLGLMDMLFAARDPFKARLYGTIDADRGIRLMNDAALDFLDRHVKGEANDFPAGFHKRFPEARAHDAAHVRHWWLAFNAARGCTADKVRASMPANDPVGMRLGQWASAASACND
ncbi:hypothetical protein [Sphingosinicella sp.]|uniref:alpha/beta hydrolase n=1 Tax=Sphingosinicella sp. TaxID=1917971 RepID=UPI0035AD914A